ncbi:DUF885 domain-containing protein [Aquimarina sp. U1-2]|uniref:DUF885 domain-containing protein n=1 Tax=Aquimarina sp. U1-2 TaxID=2823141 RepID=UPI001AEC964D|nr:DUF885 domain-containing protein [Aquimarina sp. U1-2]MBP2832980.1 DUF885 domain-containing protein [Aquimarina sp. U1-2]
MKHKITASILLLFYMVLLNSCNNQKKQTKENIAVTTESVKEYSERLNEWFEKQFQDEVSRSPMRQTYLGIKTEDYGKWDDISSKREADDLLRAKQRLSFLKDSINTSLLNDATLLSYQLMKQDLENQIEDFSFRLYDYPVNQMNGMHAQVPAFLINMHSIDTKTDAGAYVSRLLGIKPLFRQLVGNLKIREKNGIVPPKFVFTKVLDDCKNIVTGRPFDASKTASTLLTDFKHKIAEIDISEQERSQLIAEANQALIDSVQPAYEHLVSFLEGQQQRATTDDGCWKFPKGTIFYNRALRRTTTTDMTADQIHKLGLKEVDRIHNEMKTIMKQVAFEGTLHDFFTYLKENEEFYFSNDQSGRAAYLKEAETLINKMRGRLDELFITKPKADIIVKAVEPFREKSAGKAFYQQGTPDGSRPGRYYANLYNMKAMPKYQMEALAYHEGIPGHHMQRSISLELNDIPKFRVFGKYTAYTEGWGLYTELLPKEIGLYKDPYSDFGRLAMELWRACRLVVDTGIHAKKWTREDGIKYYVENTPNAESDAIKMVERHIVMPSQATAYKIGMNKILELRKEAKKKLGDQFDIREFHDVILTNGPVPLNILEELVQKWIAKKSEMAINTVKP